jgi:hypothetical protein
VYWEEILCRAHFGASTALLRTWEWVRGARYSLENDNVLVLAATLRGVLEATADAYDAFEHIPLTLAACHSVVRRALNGSLTDVWASAPELETLLFHFAYAKRIESESEPRLVEAKSAKEYVQTQTQLAPLVADVYATLCQYSHPSTQTVFLFGEEKVEHDHMDLAFDPHLGAERMRTIIELSETIGMLIVSANVMPCVMTLQVLNRFDVPNVATPWAETVSWGGSDAWREIEERLRHPSPRSFEGVTERTLDELRRLASPARKGRRDRIVPPTKH